MYPFNVFIGSLSMSGYQIFHTIGLILLVIGEVLFLDKDAPIKRWQVFVTCIVGITTGVTGAKLTHLLLYAEQYRGMPPGKVWLMAGHAYIGGAMLALVAVYILFRYYKVGFLYAGDYTLPFFGLFRTVARIGCFLAGCCHGTLSNLSWSCYFGDALLRHPTQIYMMAVTLPIFIAGRLSYRRLRDTPGIIFFLSVMMYGIGRFIVEFLRVDSPYILGPFKFSQVVLGLVSAYGVVGLRVLSRKYAKQMSFGIVLRKYFIDFAISALATAFVALTVLSIIPKVNYEEDIEFHLEKAGIKKIEVKKAADYKRIKAISSAIQEYKDDNGFYPTQEQGLNALVQKPDTKPIPWNWRGPYLEPKLLLTKEGKQYQYSLNRYSDVWSYKIIAPLFTVPEVKKGRGYTVEVEIHHALTLYRLHNKRYPTQEQGLGALIEKPKTGPIPQNWRGPYLKEPLKDKEGRGYRYKIEEMDGRESYSIYTE